MYFWCLVKKTSTAYPLTSIALVPSLPHTHFVALSLTNTQPTFPYDFPQALGTECKSRQNSFSSTIHLSTGLLGRKKEERERVSINHLTPGYIYAHSNEFNKESSPWSNILSGTSSLSPSSTPPSSLPPSLPSLIPQETSDCEVAEDASARARKGREREKTSRDTRRRLSLTAKIIPWARDLENFISLFIIKLLNLNLTQSFSCWSPSWGFLQRLLSPTYYRDQNPSSTSAAKCGSPYSIIFFLTIHSMRRW